jgi:hypothetical protein
MIALICGMIQKGKMTWLIGIATVFPCWILEKWSGDTGRGARVTPACMTLAFIYMGAISWQR